MTAGKDHYKQNIYDNAFVRFYVATNTAMLEYPFLVGRYDESSPTLARKAEDYILDSAIGDETVGNKEVLDRADKIGADAVVCSDVLHDPETTTENIVNMLKLVEERDDEFDVLIPLQFDDDGRAYTHVQHYIDVGNRLADLGYDIDDFRLYIGGINKKSASEQIRRCINLREYVGDDVYLHALGVGATREWIATIRNCPWLLDSMDNSSLVKNLIYSDKLWTVDADWVRFPRPRGTNSTVVATQYTEAALDLYNYMIASDIREDDAITTIDNDTARELVNSHIRWHHQVTGSEFEQPQYV